MATPKFWTAINDKDPRAVASRAAQFERDGWDGAVLVDSQCLFPEVWCLLAVCAQATKTISLSVGVTNPITRHPSVTASAAATVQMLSGGRFVLGVGRGDSALAYIGAAPMIMGRFESSLEMLQRYLRGEMVSLEEAGALVHGAERSFEKVALHDAPSGSSITWLEKFDVPKVPLEAMVTGPKAIQAAARVADSVVFLVGAEADRVRWAIETAREAAQAAGRDRAALEMGAYVCVVPHSDVNVAREMARGYAASMARFSIMNKTVVGPTHGKQREILEKIAQVYDMNAHGRGGAQGEVVDAEFIDQFTIAGPPEKCIARLKELIDVGVDRFTMPLPQIESPDMDEAYRLLCTEVLPALRADTPVARAPSSIGSVASAP